MTRAVSRNGSDSTRKAKSAQKATKSSPKKTRSLGKTPPSSPGSSASGLLSGEEKRSRRSERLGNSGIVDFKALSSRGRDYLNNPFPVPPAEPKPSSPVKRDFYVQKTFPAYDALMRFTKDYEKEHNVRLNASMITLQDRLSGMRDWEYYRLITFWCNFDPNLRNNLTCPLKTPIDQRFCSFYVQVAGDIKRKCLHVEAVSEKGHEHSDSTAPILSAPPLPATLNDLNLPPEPPSVLTKSKPSKAKVLHSQPARQKNGRVVKQRKRILEVRKKRAKMQRQQPAKEMPPLPPPPPPAVETAGSAGEEEAAENSPPLPADQRSPSPTKRPPPPPPSPRSAKAWTRRNSPDDVLKCGLCDYPCHSADELAGHTWLRHQILTETWDLH